MNIEIFTKIQIRKLVKEEVERQLKTLYKELDKIRGNIILLKEEFIANENTRN